MVASCLIAAHYKCEDISITLDALRKLAILHTTCFNIADEILLSSFLRTQAFVISEAMWVAVAECLIAAHHMFEDISTTLDALR
jgi:hypothetical protein